MTRAEALATAAGVIARDVPDLPGLVSLLEHAGQMRLARALRARMARTAGYATGDGLLRLERDRFDWFRVRRLSAEIIPFPCGRGRAR